MPGHVKVRGIQTGLFVAMDSKGRLYAQVCFIHCSELLDVHFINV